MEFRDHDSSSSSEDDFSYLKPTLLSHRNRNNVPIIDIDDISATEQQIISASGEAVPSIIKTEQQLTKREIDYSEEEQKDAGENKTESQLASGDIDYKEDEQKHESENKTRLELTSAEINYKEEQQKELATVEIDYEAGENKTEPELTNGEIDYKEEGQNNAGGNKTEQELTSGEIYYEKEEEKNESENSIEEELISRKINEKEDIQKDDLTIEKDAESEGDDEFASLHNSESEYSSFVTNEAGVQTAVLKKDIACQTIVTGDIISMNLYHGDIPKGLVEPQDIIGHLDIRQGHLSKI